MLLKATTKIRNRIQPFGFEELNHSEPLLKSFTKDRFFCAKINDRHNK